MDVIIAIIKDVGFPVFVAVFVLLRLEPAVRRLERTMGALMIVLAKSNGVTRDTVVKAVHSTRHRSMLQAVYELLDEHEKHEGGQDG